ncbi:SPOSA6832_00655 [Sporobolomyces salmonicolor]|uniref:SPOSA6832_00655-mRNA-1:cds n=1 Tax=Sporidiobolus salmonicolor TaxID=5005 RepID=A0A0D6EHA9_SPOSA|nr:SPOSA6832_00655 [Sporobolomyces salmonicolor]
MNPAYLTPYGPGPPTTNSDGSSDLQLRPPQEAAQLHQTQHHHQHQHAFQQSQQHSQQDTQTYANALVDPSAIMFDHHHHTSTASTPPMSSGGWNAAALSEYSDLNASGGPGPARSFSSTAATYDPIDSAYGPSPPALQQQQLEVFQAQSPHGGGDSSEYGSPYLVAGGPVVEPAMTMDLEYDLSGVAGVVGQPQVSPRDNNGKRASFGMSDAVPLRRQATADSAEGKGRLNGAQVGLSTAAEAFARLRAGSLSITPSWTTTGLTPVIPKGVVKQPASSLPMTALSFRAEFPIASTSAAVPTSAIGASTASSPRQPFSTIQQVHPSAPSPYPAYGSAAVTTRYRPYEVYNSTMYSSHSVTPTLNDSILSSATAGAPTDAYDPILSLPHSHSRHQPHPQPQPPPQPHPSSSYPSLYSSSGFDLVGVLARVVGRKNPVINLGAIDMSCSFVVADARKPDCPIVYASETFSKLTGYANDEVVGRNCRFLQAPGDQIVRQGEMRRYTDGQATNHLRQSLDKGEEVQVSLINYHKGGKPFINLVTCVPIPWEADSDEIAYHVGFQVDLVDQPAAILDKMHNGSYLVNYSAVHSTIARNPSVTSMDVASAIERLEEEAGSQASTGGKALVKGRNGTPGGSVNGDVRGEITVGGPGEVIDFVGSNGSEAGGNEAIRKQFTRLLVDECDDLIHVVSLKGALLYVSSASRSLLEYEPKELLGKMLASFCHPSDIVSVRRELKDAGVSSNPSVNLIYRIRRKNSGYMWFEASGRLHIEQGKGRKCVILTGRPREVYKMSWHDLERAGGMGVQEFWAKICVDGIFLAATATADKVLGVDPSKGVVGKSMSDLSPNRDAAAVMQALLKTAKGSPSHVRHQLNGKSGPVDVVTHFYPARSDNDEPTSPAISAVGHKQVAVIAQINLYSSEMSKHRSPPPSTPKALPPVTSQPTSPTGAAAGFPVTAPGSTSALASTRVALALPAFGGRLPTTTFSSVSSGSASFSAVPSTFKSLSAPSAASDNVFDELNACRGTSWQFELHQMRLTNKKLREEKEALAALKKKREQQANKAPSRKVNAAQRSCANCGRTNSAEWRSGPTGPKTLCNACGLRWSKARSQAAAAEAKKKAEAVAAASASASSSSAPQQTSFSGSGSDETRDGSRVSSGQNSSGGSTNPTTMSPSPGSAYKQNLDSPLPAPDSSRPDTPMTLYRSDAAPAYARPPLSSTSSSLRVPYDHGHHPLPPPSIPPSPPHP